MTSSRRLIGVFVVLFGVSGSAIAENKPADDIPWLAKSAIQEMERTIDAAKKKAIDKLKIAMKTEMQSGNLEHANRINMLIKQISESDESINVSNDPKEIVVGEWQTQQAQSVVLDKNQHVQCGNGWSGSWQFDGQSVAVVLSALNGKPQPNQIRYRYELPVEREVNGQAT